MRTTVLLTVLALAISAAGSAPASAIAVFSETDDTKVKERKVVRVVTAPDFEFETDDDLVFVGPFDENVHVGAFAFKRGGYIGVQLVDLTPELRAHFGVPEASGVMISAVSGDGPAARAGAQVGDIISAVDGEEVRNASELARIVRRREEGDSAALEVWRNGKVTTLTATIAERERPQIDVGQFLWQGANPEDLKHLEVHIDDLPESVIRLDEKRWSEALGDLYTRFESPEFQAKIKAMVDERQGMERRVLELEEKLRQLEEKLSRLDD